MNFGINTPPEIRKICRTPIPARERRLLFRVWQISAHRPTPIRFRRWRRQTRFRTISPTPSANTRSKSAAVLHITPMNAVREFSINILFRQSRLTFRLSMERIRAVIRSISKAFGDPEVKFNSTFYNFFAQDDWKITRKLKLNYGLRYDLFNIPKANQNSPFPASQKFKVDKNNFAPRLGIVYALRGGIPSDGCSGKCRNLLVIYRIRICICGRFRTTEVRSISILRSDRTPPAHRLFRTI